MCGYDITQPMISEVELDITCKRDQDLTSFPAPTLFHFMDDLLRKSPNSAFIMTTVFAVLMLVWNYCM